MGQIHSALAYYWDHQEELDADMEKRYQFAEKLRREAVESSNSHFKNSQRKIDKNWELVRENRSRTTKLNK